MILTSCAAKKIIIKAGKKVMYYRIGKGMGHVHITNKRMLKNFYIKKILRHCICRHAMSCFGAI
jgi:hypothetical protein